MAVHFDGYCLSSEFGMWLVMGHREYPHKREFGA